MEWIFELHAQAKHTNQNPFLLGAMVFSFLCALCGVGKEKEKAESPLIVEAKTYMEEMFMEPVGISDVAVACHVSQSHLSREFCKVTGVKPSEYLTKLRLKKAVDMFRLCWQALLCSLRMSAGRAGFLPLIISRRSLRSIWVCHPFSSADM